MSAPTMLAGSAMFTRHDASTRKRLDDYRKRRAVETDQQLAAAAYYAERLRHPLASEIRTIVEHEVEWRRVTVDGFADWWLITVTGGTK